MAGPGVPGNARAAMWGDKTLCDTMVNVHSDEGDHQEAPLASIPVHGVVLAEVSEVFRRHIDRQREQELQAALQQQLSLSTAPPPTINGQPFVPHGLKTYRLTLMPAEPQTVPEAVLRHVCTGQLPDDPDHLIWALWRADYLDLAATVSACINQLRRLADSKQLTLQHAMLLHQLPPLQTVSSDGSVHFMSVLTAGVLASLPAPVGMLADPALLQQFTQLPLALVKQWVESKSFKVDSGNTLAVLLTAWNDAQPSPPTEEQCRQLSALLPMASLTLCYHLQVLPHLKWWRAPATSALAGTTGLLHVLSMSLPQEKYLQSHWNKDGRGGQLTTTDEVTHAWTLDSEQLEQLWNDKTLRLTHQKVFGYVWQPRLTIKQRPERPGHHTLGIFFTLSWPAVLLAHGVQSHVRQPAAHVNLSAKVSSNPVVADRSGSSLCASAYWQSDLGWSKLGPTFQTLQDLCPTSSATWTVECSWSRSRLVSNHQ